MGRWMVGKMNKFRVGDARPHDKRRTRVRGELDFIGVSENLKTVFETGIPEPCCGSQSFRMELLSGVASCRVALEPLLGFSEFIPPQRGSGKHDAPIEIYVYRSRAVRLSLPWEVSAAAHISFQ